MVSPQKKISIEKAERQTGNPGRKYFTHSAPSSILNYVKFRLKKVIYGSPTIQLHS